MTQYVGLFATCILLLSSCRAIHDNSANIKSEDSHTSVQQYQFVHDGRSQSEDLTELTLRQVTDSNLYIATLHIEKADSAFINILLSNNPMICTAANEKSILIELSCRDDQRMAGGKLTELNVTLDQESSLYSARIRKTSASSGVDGAAVQTQLIEGLELMQ